MAADGGDGGEALMGLATHVCKTCKGRKKKCDKALPSCGYCTRKGLDCGYEAPGLTPMTRRPGPVPHGAHPHDARSGSAAASIASADAGGSPPAFALFTRRPGLLAPQPQMVSVPPEPCQSEASLYRQVLRLIAETHQFLDDITASYFQKGIHRYLPVISRTRFQGSLITLGAVPSAGFSVLLLAICLATSSALKPSRPSRAVRSTLYLAAKSICAQVQGSSAPSVHLVQARLLLALHEYMEGRPEEAFEAIAGCARMAYAARIHRSAKSRPSSDPTESEDPDLLLQSREAANTWWGITICERAFFCELSVVDQPLVTVIPGGDACPLPTEPHAMEHEGRPAGHLHPELPAGSSVSCLRALGVGHFGRLAQAAWIMDQVLEAFEISSLDARLLRLGQLDATLQGFLGALMQHPWIGPEAHVCEAVALTIKVLFMLHRHVPRRSGSQHASAPPRDVGRRSPASNASPASSLSLEQWSTRSQAMLDTATKMVVDVVEAHGDMSTLVPSYSYMVAAALRHIHGKPGWAEDSWLGAAEGRLRATLGESGLELSI